MLNNFYDWKVFWMKADYVERLIILKLVWKKQVIWVIH